QLIIRTGQELGYWGTKELQADTEGRARLGKSEVEALRVDYSKFNKLTGWTPEYSWEEGVRESIKWSAEHRERWATRIDWSTTARDGVVRGEEDPDRGRGRLARLLRG